MTIRLLPEIALLYMLVFARVGAMVMLVPGIGETTVPVRVRLLLAVFLTLVFQPVVAGRSYRILSSTNLEAGTWAPLPGSPPVSDNGDERTVTDTAATEARKFYQVEVTKP